MKEHEDLGKYRVESPKGCCLFCESNVMRFAINVYKTFGLKARVSDYSEAHFQQTVELVRLLMRHMKDEL